MYKNSAPDITTELHQTRKKSPHNRNPSPVQKKELKKNSAPDITEELHYTQKTCTKETHHHYRNKRKNCTTPKNNPAQQKPIITKGKKEKKTQLQILQQNYTIHPKTTHTLVLHRFNTGHVEVGYFNLQFGFDKSLIESQI